MICIDDSRVPQRRLRSDRAARTARVALCLGALWLFGVAAPAAARPDRTPPTKPTNFRVTAVTPFSVSLAWSASSDNSGDFSYLLASTVGGGNLTLPKTATVVYGDAGRSNTFQVIAVDSAGNESAPAMLTTP